MPPINTKERHQLRDLIGFDSERCPECGCLGLSINGYLYSCPFCKHTFSDALLNELKTIAEKPIINAQSIL